MIDAIKNGINVSNNTSRIIKIGVAIDAALYSFTSFNKVRIIDSLLSFFQYYNKPY